jgi:hypothetical protein
MGAVVLACAAPLVAGTTKADDAPPVEIEFTAPPQCPDAGEFLRRVSVRAPHLRGGRPGETVRHLRASVSLTESGAEGLLVAVERDGRTAQRTVRAPDCEQATEALVLIVALAVDQPPSMDEGAASPSSTLPTGSSVPTGSSLPTGSPPSGGLPPVPSSPPGPATSSHVAPAPPVAEAPAHGPRGMNWAFEGFAGAVGAVGLAPGPSMGFAASVGLVGEMPSGGLWAPALSLGYVQTFPSVISDPTGTASFGIHSGLAQACPLALRVLGAGRLRLCAVGEYGVLSAAGSNTVNPRSASRPWSAVGLDGQFQLRVLGPLSIGGAIGILAPLASDRFVIGSETVFELPSAAGQASLGLGLSVP